MGVDLRAGIRWSCYLCCLVQTARGRRLQKRGTKPHQSSPPPSSWSCIWCCRASAWPLLCICNHTQIGKADRKHISMPPSHSVTVPAFELLFPWSEHTSMLLQTLLSRRHVHTHFKVNLSSWERTQTNRLPFFPSDANCHGLFHCHKYTTHLLARQNEGSVVYFKEQVCAVYLREQLSFWIRAKHRVTQDSKHETKL